jgi:Uma2 family endonuclease
MTKDPRKDEVSEVKSSYRVDIAGDERADVPNDHILDEPVSEAGKWVSEEEYWEHYYNHPDFNYEWNDGILEEKPVSDVATVAIYYWFLTLLYAYLEKNPIAKVGMLEFGVRLALPHKTAIRKPDFFLVRNDNTLSMQDLDRSYRGICDLAVEALSDSSRRETERDTRVKYAEYEGIGIREYYILHTDEGNLGFYRLNDADHYEPIPLSPEGVVRSEVLPGFQFRITDLLGRPTLIDMATDPIYQGFVFSEYAAARQQAEQERQRADQERQRADQERQRADQERQRADQERQRAEQERQRAEQERQRAEQERQRAERLAAILRDLGADEADL